MVTKPIRGGARANSVSWSYSTKKLLTEGLNVERLNWCNANVGSIYCTHGKSDIRVTLTITE